MSKHKNYSKMYEPNTQVDHVEESSINQPAEQATAQPEPPKVQNFGSGTVVGCTKLNVRARPTITADVLEVLPADSEVGIFLPVKNNKWFKVMTQSGVEGFCMQQYINRVN